MSSASVPANRETDPSTHQRLVDKRPVSRRAMSAYLDAIAATPLLTAAEEVDLAKRREAGIFAAHLIEEHFTQETLCPENNKKIQVGSRTVKLADLQLVQRDGEAAYDHLQRANLRLVVSIAKKYWGKQHDAFDLIQEGNVGLIDAIARFDHTKGYKFSTYATWWIRRSILEALDNNDRTIRLPSKKVEDGRKIEKATRNLLQDLGRAPSIEEIAEEAELSIEMVTILLKELPLPVSLDASISETESESLGSGLADDDETLEDVVLGMVERDELWELLCLLNDRERDVVSRRFGLSPYTEPQPWKTIANDAGCSIVRARSLMEKAIEDMKLAAQTPKGQWPALVEERQKIQICKKYRLY